MSSLDAYIQSVEENKPLALPELPSDNEVTEPRPVVQQEVVDSVMQMEDELSTAKLIEGTAVSVTGEIGTGVGLTYLLNRYRPAMKWLRSASHVSKLGIVAPEPGSTVVGIAGLATSEALIWAGSNLLGQSIRKAYGIQEEYSAGEALAAGVFGTTLVVTKADKLIFGLARPAVDDVWKGREMIVGGTKKFISGAALGLAESIMRQEIEVLMNDDKNRNEYDYLFSALAGGGFNTLFGMWSRTGKWGRDQAEATVRGSKEQLAVKKAEAEERLKAAEEPLPTPTQYGFGGGVAMAAKSSERHEALKQLQQIQEAEEVIDDALNNILAANKKLADREANPQPIKDVVEEPEIPKTLKELRTNFINNKRPVPAREGEFPYIDTPEGYFKQGDVYRHKDDPDFKVEETDAEGVVKLAEDIANEAGGDGVYQLRRHMGPLSNPEDASKALREKAEELAPVQQAQRDLLRQKYGDTVTVYRVEDPNYTPSPDRDVSSWSLEKKSVEERLLVEGTVLKEKTISVDDVQFVYNHKEAEVLLKDDVVDAPKAEEPEAPTPLEPAPKTPEQTPDETKLTELTDRIKNINRDNVTTELPKIEREAKRLDERVTDTLRKNIHGLIKDSDNTEKLQAALDAVVFKRKLNAQVIDTAETAGGRTTQAARRDSDKFNYEAKFSYRAAKEDASLSELETSLRQRLEGAESDDLSKMFKDYTKIRPTLKAKGKEINKKATKKAKDKAKPPVTEEQKAEKLQKALATKKEKLQKELDEKRGRFGDDEALADAQAKEAKPKKPEDPEITDLKARIKFYDDAEADVVLIDKLERELARVVEIEASSVVGAQRAETTPKPTGPTKTPGKADELRKKIADTRARMRKRVADIDKAQAQINKERELSEVFRLYEQHFFDSLDKDASTRFSRGLRTLQQARQLALIDQLPSVAAGIPTGAGAMAKQFVRVLGTATYETVRNRSLRKGLQYAHADTFGAIKMLTDREGLLTAMKRTFRESASATTQGGSRFSDEISRSAVPRGEHALIAKAYSSAKRKADALDNVSNKFSGYINANNFWYILSLGVRGIQSVDELFKRQVIKGRIWSQAMKNGMKAYPNDPAKAAAYAEQNYNSAWKDNDGLAVLDETNEFYDEINQVNEELLFASNVDNVEDIYIPASEKLIKPLNEMANDTDSLLLGNTLKLIMPYIGVPIRGAYRMAHYSLPGAGIVKSAVQNPYTTKIKRVEAEIKEGEALLHTNISDDLKKATEAEIKTFKQRLETLTARRIKYNSEMVTDFFVGSSLMAIGGLLAQQGLSNGSLAWMTPEQREKNGLKPYNMFGVNYVSAMPWAGPLAFGGDIAAWFSMKAAQDEETQPLLTKDQSLPTVLKSSFVQLLQEQPLSSGTKAVQEVATGEGDVYRNAIAQIVASYVPIPAEARKITQMLVNEEKTVDDLRGGTFSERVVYSAFGVGPASKKTDRLGEHIQTPRTWLTQTVTRLAPQAETVRTELDRIIATDIHDNIAPKPSTLMGGVKMTEYRNDDGLTLDYIFNMRLRKTTVGGKRIKEKIKDLINSDSWKTKFEKGWQAKETDDGIIPDKFVNPGLQQLNTELQKFYNKTRKEMLKDKRLLKQFINSDEENLLENIEKLTVETDGSGTPLSPLDVLGIE